MIVVDTNVIAASIGSKEKNDLIRQILRRDGEWHSPFLWLSEFRNVLVLLHRRGLIQTELLAEAFLEARDLVPPERTHDVDDRRVLELALRSGCTAYDCEFIAVAEELGTRLLTWDKQLLKQFPKIAVKPEDFSTTDD